MKPILRQLAWLAIAAWVSWFVLLRAPGTPDHPRIRSSRAPVLEVTPLLIEPPAAEAKPELVARLPEPESQPEPSPAPVPGEVGPAGEPRPRGETASAAESAAASEPGEAERPEDTLDLPPAPPRGGAERLAEEERLAAPDQASAPPPSEEPATASEPEPTVQSAPPPELGVPRGEEEPGTVPAPVPIPVRTDEEPAPPERLAPDAEAMARPPARSVETLMHDPRLVAQARKEFDHGQSKGFTTVLLATPEDQLEIARFFGEELVLVPRRALDPSNPSPGFFRLTHSDQPRIEEVKRAAPLQPYRQYRDLFDYEYARLPEALRELRRSVLGRGEIYLFAALLSPEEWALIIGRRQEALARAGRAAGDVQRFVLRYVRFPGGFDLAVEEIVFDDGTRFRPAARNQGARNP